MHIDKELVERIADLAKLEFNEAELQEISTDLQQILDLIDKLNELDTDGIEPLIHLNENVAMREDKVKQIIERAEILAQAPHSNGEFYKVPKVIKK